MRSSFVALGFFLALGAGCSTPSVPAGGSTGPSPATSASACAHPYYPIRQGYEIGYTNTITGAPESAFTMKVAKAERNTATLEYVFSQTGAPANATPLTMTQELECAGGNIRAKGQLDMASALSGMQVRSTTKKSTGELLPSDLAVGSEWDNEFQVETETDSPVAVRLGMGRTSSTMVMHHKAIREEDITVPAGTYRALVVETDMTITMSFGSLPAQKPTTVRSTEYWVKDVGLVKTVTGTSKTEAARVALP
ncbi:MAG TPA: hypothetical protein VN397_04360 [Candidatus Methylomirabilis sp.]|nr:hypothetical protein [Candidatus Methylomirabilis sp.]